MLIASSLPHGSVSPWQASYRGPGSNRGLFSIQFQGEENQNLAETDVYATNTALGGLPHWSGQIAIRSVRPPSEAPRWTRCRNQEQEVVRCRALLTGDGSSRAESEKGGEIAGPREDPEARLEECYLSPSVW